MKRIVLASFGIFLMGIIIGLSIFPSSLIIYGIFDLYNKIGILSFLLVLCIVTGICYIIFGFVLLTLIVFIRRILSINSSPLSSNLNSAINNFAIYHGLIAIAEKLFLPLIRGTYLLNLFFKGLGMSIGKNTLINSYKISDCNLIEIGDNCMIGGDVIINGHSAEAGYLHKGKVKIGNNVSIGSYSTILCGTIIEDNVIIGANCFIPKNSLIKADGVYGGVPIKTIKPYENVLAGANSKITKVDLKKEVNLLKTDNNYVAVLNTQYETLRNEILSVYTFLTNVFVSSLAILFSILLYSILEGKPKAILTIPPLAILSSALLLSTTTAMLRIAYKMAEIEIHFQTAGYNLFNWETSYGALGTARLKELDGILVMVVYSILIAGGLYLTISDVVITSEEIIIGNIKTKTMLYFVNGFLIFWLVLSGFYVLFKTNYYKLNLEKLKENFK